MEIWDLYDEQGNKTGETWERSRAKEIPEGRYHIVCDILIRHQDGAFLLTFRDPHKDIYPGCWEASAGGSALAGETPEECARREMLEETGLKAEKLELISVNYKPQSRSVVYAFLSVVNCQKDTVLLQEGETVDYRWVAPDAFLRLISEEPILKIQYPRYKPYLDQLKENCRMDEEKYMKHCYELAIRAGKKGFDTFGALLVHNGEILEEAENTADWNKGLFGHAEFNLVHKCANRYSDNILKESVLYTSCAPCERCLCAIASLGVENVVFGVSYEEFSKLTPKDAVPIDREGLLQKLGIRMKLTGPVLEEEGMHVFEWWGGEYRPLEELIAEMAEVRKNNENKMKLIEPTMEYCEQVQVYRQEFLDSGDSMDGTGGLREFDDPRDWIDYLAKHKDPKTVPEGRVPATQLIFVREEDKKIVGMLDIRHYLSEYLEKFGGNIGYSVAPSERRKGYATLMLKAALPVCRGLGMSKVLITCIKGNEGSKRTILNNGGVYESTVNEPDEKIELEKYWITL